MKNLEDNKVLVEITITVFEKDETYEIVYHFNGGTPHPNTVYTYRKDQLPLILLEPTLSRYRFLGWYEDENLFGSNITEIPSGSTGKKCFMPNGKKLLKNTQ